MGARTPQRGFNFVKLILFVVAFVILILTSVAQVLPDNEVEALQAISTTLGNPYWPTIGPSSCLNATAFNGTIGVGLDNFRINSTVVCDCTYNSNTVCHVTRIFLRGLNLTGTIPVEFANLSFLRDIDLTRNYLNGTLPSALGQLPSLVTLSLAVNRLSGTIPAEIGNITTLEELGLENNLLQGNLPPNLGNLRNLRRL